jgi:hypothetical protein
MAIQMSGSRGDDPWPALGQPLYCSQEEGIHLIKAGIAVETAQDAGPPEVKKAEWPPAEDRAVVPEESEKRAEGETQPPTEEEYLSQVAPRRGPGRPRKDSLPT